MSKIIILRGPKNVGKSTSLRILIEKLLNNPANSLIYPGRDEIKKALDSSNDCMAIFELPDGRKVGIIAWGDPGYTGIVQECLDRCLQYDCDVIVGASRSYLKPGSVFEVLYIEGAKPGNLLTVTTPFIVHNPPANLFGEALNKFLKPYNIACANSINTIITNS